jgi:glycosyltransferase involved in cell wall biosynthesis
MPGKIGLFLASAPTDGGAYQYSLSMFAAIAKLAELGYETAVVCTNQHWREHLHRHNLPVIFRPITVFQQLMLKCIKFGLMPLKFWRSVCAPVSPIARLLAEQRCDLWIFPSQDEWAYAAPVNALGTIHDLMHRYESRFPEVSSWGKYARRELHYRKLCKWTSALLVDSQVGKQQVIDSYKASAERIYVLPFVAPGYICAQGQTNTTFEAKYKLPEKFIFYPAQFWQHKNHARLIRAVASLTKDIPDLALVLIGSRKNNYAAVRRLVDELKIVDRVHFLDYVPNSDIATFYQRARAMIMPTFFGPTNIPPLEAFATGCPAAVSNIYGMAEQVGDAALLFDPESVPEIAQAIKSLWVDDRLCAALVEKGKRKHSAWNQQQFDERVREIIDTTISTTRQNR